MIKDEVRSEMYTVLMVDPDAPSRDNPSNKYWLHWAIGNIKASEIRYGVRKPTGYEEIMSMNNLKNIYM